MKTTPYLLFIILLALLLVGCQSANQAPACAGQHSLTAFTHVNLLPMTAEIVLEDQTVLVAGDRIAQVSPANVLELPPCTTIVNGQGAYLLPGLADMHVHLYEESLHDWPKSPLDLYLAYGVTTIRDSGANPIIGGRDGSFALELREQIEAGQVDGPTIYSPGLIIKGIEPNMHREAAKRKAAGFDYLKSYNELTPGQFATLMGAAAEFDMYAYGHIPYRVGLEEAAAQGLDEIAHVEEIGFELIFNQDRPLRRLSQEQWVALIGAGYATVPGFESGSFDETSFTGVYGPALDAVIETLRENDLAVTATVALGEIITQKLFAPETYLARPEIAYLPGWYPASVRAGQDKHQLIFTGYEEAAVWKNEMDRYILLRLHEAGIPIVVGTDAGTDHLGIVAGPSVHDELHLLTENGFTPYEALQAATINPAQIVARMTGGASDFGTIEAGRCADLILVSENPLTDLATLRAPLAVMAHGRYYPAESLQVLRSLPGQGE